MSSDALRRILLLRSAEERKKDSIETELGAGCMGDDLLDLENVQSACWLRTRATVLRNYRLRRPSHLTCWRICLSILAFATAVSAQQPNTIQGKVSDSGHSTIANARIE